MDDKKKEKKIMKLKEWNQKQVADYLGRDKSLITRVLRHGRPLQPPDRKLLKMLLN